MLRAKRKIICLVDLDQVRFVPLIQNELQAHVQEIAVSKSKLYITSTLNIDLIFWQTDCVVTVVLIMTYFFQFSSFLVEIHCKLNQKYSIKI